MSDRSSVDSSNKALSVMGPECCFCGHRLRNHHSDGCHWLVDGWLTEGNYCPCGGFDDGWPAGYWSQEWHRMRRHKIEDISTVVPYGERHQRREYHFRCSCGKEWRGKSDSRYLEDHGFDSGPRKGF